RVSCPGILGPELLVELPLPRAELPRDVEDHGEVQAAAAVPAIARQAPAGDVQHAAGAGSRWHRTRACPPGTGTAVVTPSTAFGCLNVHVVPQIGAGPGEPGSARVRMLTYASPGGPPGT